MNIKTYEYTDEELTRFTNWVKEQTLAEVGLREQAADFAYVIRQPNILGKVWHKVHGDDIEGHVVLSIIRWPKKVETT